MTKEDWVEELRNAVASRGLRWLVFGALVEQTSPMCYAELTDEARRTKCRISLARDRFANPETRREEILRQLRQGMSVR